MATLSSISGIGSGGLNRKPRSAGPVSNIEERVGRVSTRQLMPQKGDCQGGRQGCHHRAREAKAGEGTCRDERRRPDVRLPARRGALTSIDRAICRPRLFSAVPRATRVRRIPRMRHPAARLPTGPVPTTALGALQDTALSKVWWSSSCVCAQDASRTCALSSLSVRLDESQEPGCQALNRNGLSGREGKLEIGGQLGLADMVPASRLGNRFCPQHDLLEPR